MVLAWVEDSEKTVPPEQWEQVAQVIDASTLGNELYKIRRTHEGGAVDDLMRACMPYWTATYAYAPQEKGETFDSTKWAIGGYSLALNLINRWAYFTDIGIKWNRMPKAESLPYVHAYIDRLDESAVLGVGLQTTEEDMSVTLRSTATQSLKERVEQHIIVQEDTAWRQARITHLELHVPAANATATVDFKRTVVNTDRSIPLRAFVDLVARYVAFLSDKELESLGEWLDQAPATQSSSKSG
jgi:hypothetical protein